MYPELKMHSYDHVIQPGASVNTILFFFFADHKLTLLNCDGVWESSKGEYIDKINLCMRQTSQT